ncbi:MAG: bestrophin family ion channel [Bacteroidota bacterium]
MQKRRRYTFFSTLRWTSKYLFYFILFDSIPVILYQVFGLSWMQIPWQPISLIGIAVAFYLGFKNNSSYERLWEARKIWGGIVNASRSFTVMARDFVFNENKEIQDEEHRQQTTRRLVNRHIAWLYSLTFELRKPKSWEHNSAKDNRIREQFGAQYAEEKFEFLRKYLDEEEYNYVLSKGNRSSHLLSMQSRDMMQLREVQDIEHFRHLKMQSMLTELYALQGKSERIKNFPFPRQYATVNYFFVVMFIILLPFGMMDVFATKGDQLLVWLAIPFSVIGSWVFWTMEMIGDYSENPFEGLYNDVPISSLARGIEIDILQMLDETDLPEPPETIYVRSMELDL